MTLLVSRCESAILHALGTASLPPEVSALELIDRAGYWLCSHPWTWLNRTGTLSTVANVNYINVTSGLPTLRALVSAHLSDRLLVPCSLDEIAARRASASASGLPTVYALSRSIDSSGVFTLRMELFSTPSAVNTIQVFYRAGWQAPLSYLDTSRIAIPEEWEGLFLEILIAYAMGVEERDIAGVAERLETVRRGSQFQNLVRQDSMTQSNFGPMRGGGVEMQMGYVLDFNPPQVPAP